MSTRYSILGFTLLGLLLVGTGCGGDDGEALNKAEWIAAADAICVDMNARLDAIAEPQTLEEMADSSEEVSEVWRGGVAELRELGFPESDQLEAGEVLDAFEQLVDDGLEFVGAFVDSGSLDEMTVEVETLFRDLEASTENATRMADAYGLDQCFVNPEE